MKLYYVDESAVPRFHKARPVPYIMKEKIEDELQRLQDDDIIESVAFSKWAAPIVPVRKGTGVRICGDYKMTLNQAIVEDKYPVLVTPTRVTVLQRLQNAGLKVNQQECELFRSSVTYLRHRIDRHGLHPTTEKVEAIRNAPNPTNVKELRAWLGLLNYYGRCLENLSSKLAPLYMLLKKEVKWMWNKTQEDAFIEAKEALQSDALLVHFDLNKPLVLACDASPYGCGAVLSHQN